MPQAQNLEKFLEYYARLNPQQKKAVDTIEGPVMVIAGPGTGKTQILTLRIANILRQADIGPENILALTFTESGVASMRKRLAEVIGSPAYYVSITTFHSFCNDIIKNYPEEFPTILGAKSITEVDQIKLLETIITQAKLSLLRPFGEPFHYLRASLSSINDLKREGVSPERFGEIIQQEEKEFTTIDDLYHEKGAHKGKMKSQYQDALKHIEKNKELSLIYSDYQKALREHKYYDYSDMIMEVLARLQDNQDLLFNLQEKYHYILVDEHQDTNNAQNKILELLANFHPSPNLFVVGDEKQAIFRFQGASLENFLYFKHLYSEATLIPLEHNYRSTQTILDSAHNLMPQSAKLTANVQHQEKAIQAYAFSQPDVEYFFLAHDISDKLKQGIVPRDIAILYRDNRDALPIARMLERFGVPYGIESDQDLLHDQEVQKIILLFRALGSFGEPELLIKAMHINFLGIDPLDIFRLTQHSHQLKKNIFEIITTPEDLDGLSLKTQEAVTRFADNLATWQSDNYNESFLDLFSSVVRDSGFLAYILKQSHYIDTIEKTNALFSHIRGFIEDNKDYGLKDFLAYLTMVEEHGILIKHHAPSTRQGVRLMTAHKSKGLEFDYVYIANAFDGHWGGRRRYQLIKLPQSIAKLPIQNSAASAQGSGEPMDDERNLFYVALTRAKKEITVSYSQANIVGKEQLPCQFLQEIDPNFLTYADTTSIETAFAQKKEIVFAAPQQANSQRDDIRTFVQDTFTRYGLSVTALNNYLKCPWRYFYENLLQIPRAPSRQQLYGIAIHAALKDFFDSYMTGESSKELLLHRFQNTLQQQPLRPQDHEEVLRQGHTALSGYFEHYRESWPRYTATEFMVKGVELTPPIRLRGMIDKIEFLNTDLAKQLGREYRGDVNVVDYKTGNPKTRGEIEGSTKNSTGDYKRQLVFYNLLLNHYSDGRYRMVSGQIDFVEPNDKGQYKKELFAISPEEIEELEQTIHRVADEVTSIAFWNRTCDDRECPYCHLRSLMS